MRIVVRLLLKLLDVLTAWTPAARHEPAHLRTGRVGEEAAYFYLRKLGYVIVAKNWRGGGKGEIDLIAWDKQTLCFIEVKTRGSRGEVPAEAAVDMKKRGDLVATSRLYRRRIASDTQFRFDVVSVYLGKKREIELMKGAFEPR